MRSLEVNPNNFRLGLKEVNIPELGQREQGKVRDIWQLDGDRLVLVTTDRLSAFDSVICTVPGKGQALNQTSAYWFRKISSDMSDLGVNTHMLDVPHPSVMVVRKAGQTLPVEMVLRSHLARSSTSTSVFRNYFTDNPAGSETKVIYGERFPQGLLPNQAFPEEIGDMGIVVTPTTKAEKGKHDEMLTRQQAERMVDRQFGDGIWDKAVSASIKLYRAASKHLLNEGLIMADTKLEWGIIDGELVLIDEVFTPDSSRFWRADTYGARINEGKDPQNYDKEIVRKYLAGQGYTGEGKVPDIPDDVISATSLAYKKPYEMISGHLLTTSSSDPEAIRQAILAAYHS